MRGRDAVVEYRTAIDLIDKIYENDTTKIIDAINQTGGRISKVFAPLSGTLQLIDNATKNNPSLTDSRDGSSRVRVTDVYNVP